MFANTQIVGTTIADHTKSDLHFYYRLVLVVLSFLPRTSFVSVLVTRTLERRLLSPSTRPEIHSTKAERYRINEAPTFFAPFLFLFFLRSRFSMREKV